MGFWFLLEAAEFLPFGQRSHFLVSFLSSTSGSSAHRTTFLKRTSAAFTDIGTV